MLSFHPRLSRMRWKKFRFVSILIMLPVSADSFSSFGPAGDTVLSAFAAPVEPRLFGALHKARTCEQACAVGKDFNLMRSVPKKREFISRLAAVVGGQGHDWLEDGDQEIINTSDTSDWREFRARLVQQEQHSNTPNSKDAAGDDDGFWVHTLPQLESGCLLLSNPSQEDSRQNYFKSSVLVLIEHGEAGSVGFINNRPTPYTVGEVAPSLEMFSSCPLFFGGPVGDGIQVMHRVPGVRGARKVVNGLYFGGDLKSAAELIEAGRAKVGDFRFYYKYSAWAPGQLEEEVAEEVWLPGACASSVLFQPSKGAHVHTHTHLEHHASLLRKMRPEYAAAGVGSGGEEVDEELAEAWEEVLQGGGAAIEAGATLVARIADHSLTLGSVRLELDAIAAAVREHLGTPPPPPPSSSSSRQPPAVLQVIQATNHVLFSQMQFRGNEEDYYDVRNSFIHEVLKRKLGIPLSISVVYMAVAARVGVRIDAVNSPGHVLLMAEVGGEGGAGGLDEAGLGGTVYVDAFSRGRVMTRLQAARFLAARLPGGPGEEEALERMAAMLSTPMTPVRIYSRMLHNLVHASLKAGDKDQAVAFSEALTALEAAAARLHTHP